MRESETFDAFYARTVSSVTSQMRAIAAGDPQADHAIREAYARAYQQWYEVSGYRDPEAWVLDVAREAFERRRSEPAGAPDQPDTGTWPGMYRPRAEMPPAAHPNATVTGGGNGHAEGQGRLADPGPAAGWQAGQMPADPLRAIPHQVAYEASPYEPTTAQPASALASAGDRGPSWQTAPAGGLGAPATTATGRAWPVPAGQNRQLIAIVAVIMLLVVGGVAYLVFGRGKASPQASSGHTAPGTKNAGPRMLSFGRTGTLAAVPWSIVASGWTLADFSTAQPSASGQPAGGTTTTYLVDPEGGKYVIYQWPAGSDPVLLAWSHDTDSALFQSAGGGGYQLLTLHIQRGQGLKAGQPAPGHVAQLTLPAGVAVAGFTRPDGENILAVKQGPVENKLQRYNLAGQFQATLGVMIRRPIQGVLAGSCASAVCGALSSPDGDTAVWGLRGDEMQLVSNAGGVIRRLHVPHSGSPPSCTPVSWWSPSTILANCSAPGPAGLQLRLWLVPDDGSTPTPLTAPAGSPAGVGFFTAAWQVGGRNYATTTSAAVCSGAPSGPGGLALMNISQSGSPAQVTVSSATNNYSNVVASSGGRLEVLVQTSCPPSSSLLWLNPSTGATQSLLPAPASEVGVTAAVPWGIGPTATAG
jgi:hypothetical protein